VGIPWGHVWPYSRHRSVILPALHTPNPAQKDIWELNDTLKSFFPSSTSSLIFGTRYKSKSTTSMMGRHNYPSTIHGSSLTSRPTFSQIFLMSHVSCATSDEDQHRPRCPIITTNHRLPKAGRDLERQPAPYSLLLPQQRRFSVEIPVIREDSTESTQCPLARKASSTSGAYQPTDATGKFFQCLFMLNRNN
jgi:hypothetical protein